MVTDETFGHKRSTGTVDDDGEDDGETDDGDASLDEKLNGEIMIFF